jgi:hypothetical protein
LHRSAVLASRDHSPLRRIRPADTFHHRTAPAADKHAGGGRVNAIAGALPYFVVELSSRRIFSFEGSLVPLDESEPEGAT